jgi:hypothetical protein
MIALPTVESATSVIRRVAKACTLHATRLNRLGAIGYGSGTTQRIPFE